MISSISMVQPVLISLVVISNKRVHVLKKCTHIISLIGWCLVCGNSSCFQFDCYLMSSFGSHCSSPLYYISRTLCNRSLPSRRYLSLAAVCEAFPFIRQMSLVGLTPNVLFNALLQSARWHCCCGGAIETFLLPIKRMPFTLVCRRPSSP